MKKIAWILLAGMMIFAMAGCGGPGSQKEKTETEAAAAQTDDEEAQAIPVPEEAWEVITTPYGDLRYPAALYPDLQREEGQADGAYSMAFRTAEDGVVYDLFTLYIGGEAGDATYLGSLTGKDGSENEVYVLPGELGDLSGLDGEVQDRIYAMQEALNEVLGEEGE